MERITILKVSNNCHFLPQDFLETAKEFLGLSGDYKWDSNYESERRGCFEMIIHVTKDQDMKVSFNGYENQNGRLVVDNMVAYSIMK